MITVCCCNVMILQCARSSFYQTIEFTKALRFCFRLLFFGHVNLQYEDSFCRHCRFSPQLFCLSHICQGSICWTSSPCLPGCPVTAGLNIASWCTGWESQQQRRKLRPGSHISSVSVRSCAIWADALAGHTFSSISSSNMLTIHHRITGAVMGLI